MLILLIQHRTAEMAIRFLFTTREHICNLGRLQRSNRSLVGLFSTAVEQRSTGDDCYGDDGADDHSHSVTHVRKLEMRTSQLEEQVQDLTQRYNRALADSGNVRRRTKKIVEDAKIFGIQSFCRDLVQVADMLEQTSGRLEGQDVQGLCQSLAQIQSRLQEIFTKHGLEKMTPIGGTYDPYQHEIVCHTPAKGAELGSIAVVKQDGYLLHGRTIRHARVGIAVKTQEQ